MGNASASCAESEAPVQAVGSAELMGILAFCPWEQRAAAPALGASLRSSMGFVGSPGSVPAAEAGAGYWRFLCARLAEESQIYMPRPASGTPSAAAPRAPPLGVAASWRELFEDLHRLARAGPLIDRGGSSDDGEVFSLNVAVRFRPAQPDTAAEAELVTLPLHQKVRLLRERLGCSGKEAVSMIMRERAQKIGGPAADGVQSGEFQPCLVKVKGPDPDQENTPPGDDVNDKIVAPGGSDSGAAADSSSALEGLADTKCSVLSVRQDTSSVLAVTRSSGLRQFSFDRVFAETSGQDDVYELSARRLVVDFLNGRSAGVICYGQTGSGKTHTMFGPPGTQVPQGSLGVVPRACMEVLGAVKEWREQGHEARLGVSYVELFGSEISDLLSAGKVVGQGVGGRFHAVRATDRVGHRYVLDGHNEVHVDSWEEVEALLRAGDEYKRRAHTAMNERSTRAHTIMVLSLQLSPGEGAAGSAARQSRLFFADLGGSEQLAKSQADAGVRAPRIVVGGVEQSRITWQEYYRHRQRVQETQNINMGLFSLKRVIEALHKRSNLIKDGHPPDLLPYVPYQDSKLTMLLRECLGGSARTCIVTTAASDAGHATETLQTLRFADTCAQVQKRRDADEAASVKGALAQLEAEIEQLQAEIVRKERWETRWETRQDTDTIAGRFGEGATVERTERVLRTVLVGAEAERERLECLLQRQADLRGLSAGSALGKDYREMQTSAAADGGRGRDFRQGVDFRGFAGGAKVKAKEFESEETLAGALRFLFRKTTRAEDLLGEVGESAEGSAMPEPYLDLARKMRASWEERVADGSETRSFGKAMLDHCQAWHKAFKRDPTSRDAALDALLATGWPAASTRAASSKSVAFAPPVRSSASSTTAAASQVASPSPSQSDEEFGEDDEF